MGRCSLPASTSFPASFTRVSPKIALAHLILSWCLLLRGPPLTEVKDVVGQDELPHRYTCPLQPRRSSTHWRESIVFPGLGEGMSMSSLLMVWKGLQLFIYLFKLIYLFWRRQWHPTPVLLPGKSHGWESLVGCRLWGCTESDTTERLHFHFSLSCIGEGNGNPLQYSCLENPRDRGAW